jgi:hypothetical protein
VGLSLAELYRWDPDAIHGVFEAATARAEHTRTTATSIGDVVTAVPGSGQAHDAAQAATGSIQTDLIEHADQVEAVGRAAALAEHEVRGIKADWEALQLQAIIEGFTINKDTNEISYTAPADPRQAAEKAREFDRLHADIEALLARANTADAELADAIRGAAGQESAADINKDLDGRGEPPQPMNEAAGQTDGQAAIDGHLSEEAQSRLHAATHLSDQQWAQLQSGNLALPPDQLAYLTGLSKQFGDMSPAQILKAMDDEANGGKDIAGAFAIASNPNVNTGRFGAGESGRAPTRGGVAALPDGVQKVLKAPALDQFGGPPQSRGGIPQPLAAPMVNPGLKGLADIVARTDPRLQVGSGLDQALMDKSRELLNASENAYLPMAGDQLPELPRWYHEQVDPTLQGMLNAVSPDSKVVHDTLAGSGGQGFLSQLHTHQWQDDGLAAGNLFHSVDTEAVITNPGDPTQTLLANRAASTARIEANFLGDSHHDMLNLAGGRDSLGQVNPALAQGLARDLGHYIPDMVGDPLGNTGDFGGRLDGDAAGDNQLHAKLVFAALDSDPTAAGILHDAANRVGDTYLDQTAQAIQDGHGYAEQHMAALGRLHAVMDVGKATAYNDLQVDKYVADKSTYDTKQNWIAFWGDVAGQVPFLEHGADFLKDGLLSAQTAPEQLATITSEARGTDPAMYGLMQDLYHRGVGDTSALTRLLDPNNPGQFLPPDQAFLDSQQGKTWEAMRQYHQQNPWAIDPNDLLSRYAETYSKGLHNGLPGRDQTRPN